MTRTSAAKKPRTPKAEPEAPEPQGDVKFSGKMKIDANKAVSDLAKALLDDFKQFAPIGRTWDKCPEHEQQRMIARAEYRAEEVIQAVANMMGSVGLPFVKVTAGKLVVNGAAVQGGFTCNPTDEQLVQLRHFSNSELMVVLANKKLFDRQRERANTTTVGPLAIPEPEQRADEGELSNVGRGDGEQPHDPVTGEIPANAGDPTAQPTADSAA